MQVGEVKREVISRSAKKKMTAGDNQKANDYTEMVVYKTLLKGGKWKSVTKHEKASR